MSLWSVFVSEVLGTAILIVLGTGVVANVVLPKAGGFEGGTLMINFGWGLGVFGGVYAAYKSGAHLNPAVTIGLWASGAKSYATGVSITPGSTLVYFAGEFLGAFLGAVAMWAAYKKQFDDRLDAPSLGIFSTGPAIKSYAWNLVTEIIATFVLIFYVLVSGMTNKISSASGGTTFSDAPAGALGVALIVVAIGVSLGGPTGYAINPARDLGPRIAHFVLPIPNKDSSNWSYAWVPVVGPIIGCLLAALVARAYM
ncbi:MULTISPECIES: MIP/aquaporin family protein [unclassified Allobranchiibius]|uniref:MIP/aquaporin family protein n=1 Tax=unclassified Allobranchiibius TaxID=2649857 RepID=UPI001AA1C501|nr:MULTISPECIES: MIP/aquaporin family protein [unclassified Allobranchiibius]MBO1765339.1 aquaporin family protein [Allobranchiibius sp. GilTou38]UIJ35207.1 aquaporin family protein [Allobranchiibius sp. GilTou73]